MFGLWPALEHCRVECASLRQAQQNLREEVLQKVETLSLRIATVEVVAAKPARRSAPVSVLGKQSAYSASTSQFDQMGLTDSEQRVARIYASMQDRHQPGTLAVHPSSVDIDIFSVDEKVIALAPTALQSPVRDGFDSCLASMLPTLLPTLRRDLRTEMEKLEEKLIREVREQVSDECARLKLDTMNGQPEQRQALVANRDISGELTLQQSKDSQSRMADFVDADSEIGRGRSQTTSERLSSLVSKQGSILNVRRSAFAALADAERHGKSIITEGLKRVYLALIAVLALCMLAFMGWGFYKILMGAKYAETHHEDRKWVSEAMPLPIMAYRVLTSGFTTKINWCSIANGDHTSKHCVPQVSQPCNIGRNMQDPTMSCLPSDLDIIGTYGDPIYRYVELKVFSNRTPAPASIALEIAWEERLTMFDMTIMQQLYTATWNHPKVNELFFRKIVSIEGSPFGFAGRQGNDESEQLLASEKYLIKGHEYSRELNRYVNATNAMSFFFRAELIEREDFYETYSLLRLLEASGGLWISATSILAIFFWSIFRCLALYTKLARGRRVSRFRFDPWQAQALWV